MHASEQHGIVAAIPGVTVSVEFWSSFMRGTYHRRLIHWGMTEAQIAKLRLRLNEAYESVWAAGGKVVVKRGWFWVTLHALVVIITLGSNRRFLRGYCTTIGPWVGVPTGWESWSIESRIALLEHEAVHVRQCKKFGLGNVIVGIPMFSLLYLLVPLPIGLAWLRWRFERVAYVRGINVRLEISGHSFWARTELIDRAVEQLSGGAYAWTWPFRKSVRAYFEANIVEPIS